MLATSPFASHRADSRTEVGRLVAVFDGGGVLQHWNLHAGGTAPFGRIDRWESGTPGGGAQSSRVTADTVEVALKAGAQGYLTEAMDEAGFVTGSLAVAMMIAQAKGPVGDTLAAYAGAALDEAGGGEAEAARRRERSQLDGKRTQIRLDLLRVRP